MKALENDLHERFATAYAALEIAAPQQAGNGPKAYLAANPEASEKTAANQATTLLKRAEVRARIDELVRAAEGAESIMRAGPFLDMLLLEAAQMARYGKDAATLARIVELADRGRQGGAKFIKETRTRRMDGEYAAKSADERREMERDALRALVPRHRSYVAELLAKGEVREGTRTGDPGRTGEPVH